MVSIFDRFHIAELQQSNIIPAQHDLPGNRNLVEAPLGDWLSDALAVTNQEDADQRLLEIAAVHLWRNVGVLSWEKAFVMAKESIVWFAFAKDVSGGNAFTAKTRPEEGPDAHTEIVWRIENTTHRDIAFQWYGARMQIRDLPVGNGPRDRMERIGQRLTSKRQAQQKAEEPKGQVSLF